ncbi:MAG TPA: hypothetical protein VIK45_19390 [Candidatus Dormibacteraeota bacterium]
MSGASAGSSHVVITCLVCEEKIRTWRGEVGVECQCGAEYQARTGQLVEEPICGLLSADLRGGEDMPGPFIFIATNRLKEGRLDDERKRVPGLCDFVEAKEPRLMAFHEYVNENGTEVGVVQVHADAGSMEFHMQVIRERAARAYAETLEATTSIQVFGTPSVSILEMLRQQAGSGIPLSIKPHHLGGFTRLK